jgi:SAM-dependent methyltransferase
LGHEVTPVDISPELVRLAMENGAKAGVRLVPGIVADARKIAEVPDLKGKSFDLILLLGPLYHLLELEERLDTINGCLDMLRPGGILFASFVTIYVHLRDMASKDAGRLARELPFYQKYMKDGKYTRRTDNVSHHVTPEEVCSLFSEDPERQIEKGHWALLAQGMRRMH